MKLQVTRGGNMVAVIIRVVRRAALLLAVAGVAALLVGCEEVVPTEVDKEPIKRPPVVTPEPEPEPKVHVLSQTQLENDVLTVEDGGLSFSQAVSYEKGDFIAAEISTKTPYGLLREVTSVSDGRRTVLTTDATLEEAIKRGTVRISGRLTPDDLTPASRAELAEFGLVAAVGGVLGPAAEGEGRFGYDLSVTDGSSTLSGRIDFVLGYELTVNYDRGLKDMRFSITPEQVFTVRVSAKGAFDRRWRVGDTLKFSPLPVPVGPFPIYFTPELDLSAGVGGGWRASVSARHEVAVTAGVECKEDCGETENWNGISEVTQSQAGGVGFATETEGMLKVYVAPRLTFNLYGRVGGPYVEALPSIGARAERLAGKECLRLTLDGAVAATLGGAVEVSVLGVTLGSAALDQYRFDILGPVAVWEGQHGECEEEPPDPPDTEPGFGAQRITNQTYAVGTAIDPLVLPAATGGDSPLTYSLTPTVPGLQFSSTTRTLSGTPDRAGIHSMTYRVVDHDGDAATLTFAILVTEPAPPDTEPGFGAQRITNQTYAVGTAIDPLVLPAATGGDSPLTYSLTPTVPGLQFSSTTRTLSGTPDRAGIHSMTYRVVDHDGDAATLTFRITVVEAEEQEDLPPPLVPGAPPQAVGTDIANVEIAGQGSTRSLWVANRRSQSIKYTAGQWLEPKDGRYQRMIITRTTYVGPGQIVPLPVACMQKGKSTPANGLRFFSQSKLSTGSIQQCQVECIRDSRSIQSCVWECERQPSVLVWPVSDGCEDGYSIQLRFFDRMNDLVWPGGNRVYLLEGSNTYRLSCRPGAKVCYGARPHNSFATNYWGVGIDGDKGCDDCCYTCPDGGTIEVRGHNLACR